VSKHFPECIELCDIISPMLAVIHVTGYAVANHMHLNERDARYKSGRKFATDIRRIRRAENLVHGLRLPQ
jgi:hypothetical protein